LVLISVRGWTFLADSIIAVSIQLNGLQFIIFLKLSGTEQEEEEKVNFFLNKALFHLTSFATQQVP
jgi:hypothetical protein